MSGEVSEALPGEKTARGGEELDALWEIIDIAHETGEEINDTGDQDDQLKDGALTLLYLPDQTVTLLNNEAEVLFWYRSPIC